MGLLRQNVRIWWQPPRNITDRDMGRTVTFLELFYDLVYVVLIAQIAHSLAEHPTLEGVAGFVFLFVMVWWAWLNGSLYHDLHGNNDVRTRVFTFAQMITVGAMAIFAHGALGETSVEFALSFAAYQLILTYMWWRTGVYDPAHRPFSQPYVAVYLLTTLMMIGSVFVPESTRFVIWGIALLMSLLLPIVTLGIRPKNEEQRIQMEAASTLSPALIERFGLFTIIVLGEVLVGVVNGAAGHHHFDGLVGVTAVLGMFVAIGIWWIFFDSVSHHKPRPGAVMARAWFYLHLVVGMGIAATGAAMLNVVELAGEPLPSDVQWLLVGAISVVLFGVALLMRVVHYPAEHEPIYRIGGLLTLAASGVALALGFLNLPAIPLLIVLIALLLAPMFYGIKVWVSIAAEHGQEALEHE
jgi:low temperature requirement protein LtrA